MTKKTCFVISPIGEEGSDTRKRSDQILEFIISPAAKECGYQTIRADQIAEPGMITSQIIQYIVDSPLVIADLTARNPNVFYELAIRHAIREPLVQIIKKDEQIPFDIAGTRTIHVDHNDLTSAAEAKKQIVAQIKSLETNSNSLETPISVSLDLQMLRQSDNPEQRSLADVLSEITKIRSSLSELNLASEGKGDLKNEKYLEMEIKYRDLKEKYMNMKAESLVDPKIYKNFEHAQSALENLLNKLIQDTILQNEPLKIRVLGVCLHKSFPFIKRFIEENCELGKRIEIRLSTLDRTSFPASVLDKVWGSYYDVYESQLEEFIKRIKGMENAEVSLKICEYSYMPNWHGIMINKTHLFLSACVWNSEICMTAGENHYVYYKREASWLHNQKILQFKRWFDYGRFNSTRKREEQLIFDTKR